MSEQATFQGTPLTRRELLIARKAIQNVTLYLKRRGYFSPDTAVRPGEDPMGEIKRHVLVHYAVEKVRRPRIVKDSEGNQWRFVGGELQVLRPSFGHWGFTSWNADVMRQIGTLKDNPTEEVEDDA